MKKIFYILLLVLSTGIYQSCTKLDDPASSIPADSIISVSAFYENLNISAYSIKADSNSYLMLKGVLGEKTNPGQSITFTTSDGLLALPGQSMAEGTKSLTVTAAYREALVVLYSGKTPKEEVLVSATVGNFSNSMTVEFSIAYPEQMNLGPDFISVATSDTVDVTMDVLRSSGVVSDGVVYHVRNMAPDSISLNLPSYGILNDQQGAFKIVNPLGKAGTVDVQIVVPKDLDSIYKTVQITYQ